MQKFNHTTVLKNETIDLLNIDNDKIYIDCTLGFGGHSIEMFERNKNISIIGLDQDKESLEIAKKNLANFKNFKGYLANFKNLQSVLLSKNIDKVDGFVFDLGVSSLHFDKADRGFSYKNNGILDMRMDLDGTLDAKEVINSYSPEELAKIFFQFGEEKFSWKIALKIAETRKTKEIETTFELDEIIKSAIPKKFLYATKYPSKKVFQALRIYVNQELEALKEALKSASSMLKKDGRIAVISFHSLEDRIVKHFFKSLTTDKTPSMLMIKEKDKLILDFKLVNKKAIVPSDKEIEQNPRSRSAKLRVLQKVR